MRVFLVYNPSAGGGRAARIARRAAELIDRAGVDLTSAASASAADLTRLTALVREEDYDRVVVVGGDGTFHWAFNGLAGSPVPVALIPAGRGNDFKRNAGLPPDVDSAVRLALDGRPRPLDLIWTGVRHYIGVAGAGFDSEVTRYANTRVPVSGPLAYTAAVFYKLLSFKPKVLKIRHDKGEYENEVMFAVFGNSQSYGGGMRIAPHAVMDDGLMDVVVVERVGVPTLLRTLPKVFSGAHLPHPRIKTFRTTAARLESKDDMDLYGDGEYIAPLPLTLEVRPRHLNVVAPERP